MEPNIVYHVQLIFLFFGLPDFVSDLSFEYFMTIVSKNVY